MTVAPRPRVWDHARRTVPRWRGVSAWWARVDQWVTFVRLCLGLDADRRLLVQDVIRLLDGPAWPAAKDAVTATSLTLGLSRKTAWVQLSARLKDQHAWADGAWRRLYALEYLSNAWHGQSVAHQSALIELAYLDHRRTGTRPRGVSRADV